MPTDINVTPENLLESVVRITKERSQDSLETSLVQTMLGLLSASEIVMVKVLEGTTELVEEVIRADRDGHCVNVHRRVPADDSLASYLKRGQPFDRETRCQGWLYYPIPVQGRLSRVAMFRCHDCSPGEKKLIDGFLRIYRNYLEILHDSERDTLTGLFNRKTFDARLTAILSGGIGAGDSVPPAGVVERRSGRPDGKTHWLGIFDIDHFKRINDTHGHLYGDEVLLLLAQIMRESFRAGDTLFRYGGEEFVAVVTAVDRHAAIAAFERFRERVEAFDFPQVGTVTVSTGMVHINAQDVPSAVVGRADQALYYAKANGRNRVCSYEALLESGAIRPSRVEHQVELF